MKSFLLGIVLLSSAASAGASMDTWRYHKFAADVSGLPLREAAARVSFKYDRESGDVKLSKWEFDFAPPSAEELSRVGHLDALGAPPDSVVYSGGEWRRKTDAELEADRQAAKPLLRRALENDFFDFTRLVLVAAGDPRKDADPTPKLGFEELTPLIEEIQVSNPMAAVNLTLKGLSIDSALKRFSATWWDDAQEHDIPVEE